APFLSQVRKSLLNEGYRTAPEHVVFTSGRVRAGYRVGETLFGGLDDIRSIVHVIGERPGTGHHTFSVYITAALGTTWGRDGAIDHDRTKVVSGIAVTAQAPLRGAEESVHLLRLLTAQPSKTAS